MSETQKLLEMGYSYLEKKDLSTALQFFRRARDTARVTQDKEGEAKACLEIGKIKLNNHEPESAKEYLQIAVSYYSQHKLNINTGYMNFLLGKSHYELHEFKEALKPFKKSLKHSNKKNPWHADLHYYLGVTSIELFYLDQAHEHLYKAQKMYQEAANRRGIADSLFRLGHLYYQAEDYRMAQGYFDHSVLIYSEIQSEVDVAESCFMLGKVMSEEDNIPGALRYLQSALNRFKDNDHFLESGRTAEKMGKIYLEEGHEENAFEKFNEAIKLYSKAEAGDDAGEVYHRLARISKEKGEKEKTFQYLKEALHHYMEAESPKNSISCLEELGLLYLEEDDLKEARHYFLEAIDMNEMWGNPRDLSAIQQAIDKIHRVLREHEKNVRKKKKGLSIWRAPGTQELKLH